MSEQGLRIDIYSDVVCPWCYVGKRRLEEVRGHQLGIRGIPYFVLNGKTGMSEAQPVETFVSAIEHVTR